MHGSLQRGLMPFVLDRLRPHWPERRFLRRFLKRLTVDCVFDVGANVGDFAKELRIIGYEGLIVSIEPDPTAYRELAARATSDPRWITFEMALGSVAGREQFNIMARSDFSSFRKPTSDETRSFDDMNTVVDTVTVKVATFTQLLNELERAHPITRPYLKMDTQGFDLEVFSGASGALDRVVGIQSEVSVKRIYESIPDWHQSIACYQSAGFELAGLFSVTPWEDELIELNCYMVNRGRA
jgi:FkbM family methyltransferase